MALLGIRGNEARYEYKPKDVQVVQTYEDKTNEAIMIMEANIDVLAALRKYYEGLLRHKEFPFKKSCRDSVLNFAAQVKDMINDSRMQVSRAKLLVRIAADRKTIVSEDPLSLFNYTKICR